MLQDYIKSTDSLYFLIAILATVALLVIVFGGKALFSGHGGGAPIPPPSKLPTSETDQD